MISIIWSSEEGKNSIIDMVGKAVDKEAADICSNKPTSFRIDDMENFAFSFENLSVELTERAKILTKCLTSASHNERNLRRNKLKTMESLTPNLVYAAGLLFQSRNQRVNAIQVTNSLILRRGGSKQMTFKRLNACGICTSYKQALKYQLGMAKDSSIAIKSWKKEFENANTCSTFGNDLIDILDDSFTFDADIANSPPTDICESFAPVVTPPANDECGSTLPKLQNSKMERTNKVTGYVIVGDNLDMREKSRYTSKSQQ